MLPKFERFNTTDLSKLKNKKFKKIIVKYGFFVVYPEPEPHLTSPINKGGIVRKKGIILSKKVFKRAVDRNKYKRFFYNTILDIQKGNSELKSKTFIFHPKKVFEKEELQKDLLAIL